jgi:glycosyltransferase involved in cell wall biosynthesis
MRIVQSLRTIRLSNGGPPLSLIDMCQSFHERGHSVAVLSPFPDDVPSGWLVGEGPSVVRVGVRSSTWGLLTREGLFRARETIRGADILHLHMPWDPLNLQLARIARSLKVPYCVSIRGTLDEWAMAQKSLKKRLFMSLLGRRLLESAAFVHCTAEGEQMQSERWYPRGRSIVIPNLLDMRPYQTLPSPSMADQEFGIPVGAPVLLFMSRIHPGKGLEYVIRAMPAIVAKHPDVLLLVAGGGSPEYIQVIRNEIEQAGVGANVRLVGFVSGESKVALLCRASVLVLASSHENFGNAVFQAAACGTAVIITRQVETWRELWAAKVATVVMQDPWEIGVVVTQQLSIGATERSSQSERIRQWTLDFFGGDRVVCMYEEAYRRAAGSAT